MSNQRIHEITQRLQGISAPEWEINPNLHGDPAVSEKGRGSFRVVATLSSHPSDYGRGNMEFIANAPEDMRFLLDELEKYKTIAREITTKKED